MTAADAALEFFAEKPTRSLVSLQNFTLGIDDDELAGERCGTSLSQGVRCHLGGVIVLPRIGCHREMAVKPQAL
jgi:hypothetical protein